jgi:hypothetical protein
MKSHGSKTGHEGAETGGTFKWVSKVSFDGVRPGTGETYKLQKEGQEEGGFKAPAPRHLTPACITY